MQDVFAGRLRQIGIEIRNRVHQVHLAQRREQLNGAWACFSVVGMERAINCRGDDGACFLPRARRQKRDNRY